MKIKTNDKPIKVEKIMLKKPNKKVSLLISGLIITASLYTNTILIEDSYSNEIDTISYEYNVDENETIKELDVEVKENDSLAFLKDYEDLEVLNLYFTGNSTKSIETLPYIPSLKELSISSKSFIGVLSQNDEILLNRCSFLDTLVINGFSVGPNTIENLTNLKKLVIYKSPNLDLDFNRLTFLEELDLSNMGPYDLAISFTEEEYNRLKDEVYVNFGTEEKKAKIP